MSRVAYRARVNDNVGNRVGEHVWAQETEQGQKKKSSINHFLFFVSLTFVCAALVVMSASSRSVLGGILLFVGVVFGFAYAAREVRGFAIHRRL